MPLETGTTIAALNASNPAHTDGLNNADAHIRLIKSVLLATFPNLNGVTDVTAAQLTGMSKTLAMTGEVKMWPTTTPPAGWLHCTGAAVSRTTYSALFAVIGTTCGAGDGSTTFNLPDSRDRYIRGYWSYNPGILLSQDVQAHNHTAALSGAVSVATTLTADTGHQHFNNSLPGAGNTSTDGDHAHGYSRSNASNVGYGSGGIFPANNGNFGSTTDTAGAHAHTVAVTVSGWSDLAGAHNHAASSVVTNTMGVTVNNSAGSETRPNSLSLMFIIKT